MNQRTETIQDIIIVAIRSIVENYKYNEPARQVAIKVADNAFIITQHSKKHSDHGIYLQVRKNETVPVEYHFICLVKSCSHGKSKMMKIITGLVNGLNLKKDVPPKRIPSQ